MMDGRELRARWSREWAERPDAAALHQRMRVDILACAELPPDAAIAAARMFCELEVAEPARSALRRLIEADPGADAQAILDLAASQSAASQPAVPQTAAGDESLTALQRLQDELEAALQSGLRHAVAHENLRKSRDELRVEYAKLVARRDSLLARRESLLNG